MFSISESEAEPVVGWLFTAVKNDLCGILLCICVWACTFVSNIYALYAGASMIVSFYISPMWAWEIFSVISNICSCQTSEQRNIKLLCMHCGRRSSITSQSQPGPTAFSFSFPSFSLPFSPLCVPVMLFEALHHCMVKIQLRVKHY